MLFISVRIYLLSVQKQEYNEYYRMTIMTGEVLFAEIFEGRFENGGKIEAIF